MANNMKTRLAAAAIALFSAVSLPELIDTATAVPAATNTIWSAAVFAALYMLQCIAVPAWQMAEKPRKIRCAVFSAFFSAAMICGRQLDVYGQLVPGRLGAWAAFAVMTVSFSTAVCLMTEQINRNGYFRWKDIVLPDATEKLSESRRFFTDMAVMLICWLPVLLAVYPGFFVYDAQDEYVEVVSRSFTTHHPLLHVLLLGGTICAVHKVTGSFNAGICCYVVIQMAVMSAIFAYTLRFIRRRSEGRNLSAAALLWFALFPVNVMYVLCTTKDTLFSGFLLLTAVLLMEIKDDRDAGTLRRKTAAFFISALLMMLMRHNGVYAFAASIPFIVICEKKNRKNILTACAGALAAAVLCTAALTAVCGAGGKTDHQEMLTVPIQQLTRTYKVYHGEMSGDELEKLYEILPEEALSHYSPVVSDNVKAGFNNDSYEKDPGRYIKLWAQLGLRHPMSYLNAWLMTSYGYWYPDSVNNTYKGHTVYSYTYDESSYFGFETEPPGTRYSLIPFLESWYRDMSLTLCQQRVPVISMLFSPGFMCWVYAFVFLLFLISGKGNDMIPFILFFMVWLTVLLGPGCLNRYVAYDWMGLPLLLCGAGSCTDKAAV